jgi:hypothetical protein
MTTTTAEYARSETKETKSRWTVTQPFVISG